MDIADALLPGAGDQRAETVLEQLHDEGAALRADDGLARIDLGALDAGPLDGAQQIAVPAIVATLAICIVFFPVVLAVNSMT